MKKRVRIVSVPNHIATKYLNVGDEGYIGCLHPDGTVRFDPVDGGAWWWLLPQHIEQIPEPKEAPVAPAAPVDLGQEFVTKATEEVRSFATGSKRGSREGKGRFDLIPALPIRRLAELYERGARVYGDRNWQKGQPLSGYLDSGMRHLNDYMRGDRSEDHIVACAWNMFAYIWTEDQIKRGKLPAELNDIVRDEE